MKTKSGELVHTLGVLAGAYARGPKTALTHALIVEDDGTATGGRWVRVMCRRVELDNLADYYSATDEQRASRPTCATCARAWDKL